MKSYAYNRGYSTTDEIFQNCYFKAYLADIESLKNVALIFWNSYASSNQKQIIDGKLSDTHVVYFNELTMEMFEKHFNINWQIRLYLYTRILEENIKITQNKFEILYTEAVKINKFSDLDNSVRYINQKIQELSPVQQETSYHLTTPDAIIKMLSGELPPLPVEGINF